MDGDSGARTSRSSALAPLRERNFRYYYLSRLVNLLGTSMASVALAFAVLEVSDSAAALGLVLAAYSAPLVLLLLIGGVLADRFGRSRVIAASNLGSGVARLAIAVLVLSGQAELWQLIVLAAVSGSASAAGMPALSSVLPQLVPRAQLKEANLLVSIQRNALTVLGPAVSGILVVAIGPGWVLAVDAATFFLAAALLAPVQLPPAQRSGSGALSDLREGWQFFRDTTWLWVVVLAFAVLNAIQSGAFHTLGPVLSVRTDLGERGWGLILSAEALGLLVSSFVLLRLPLTRPLRTGMLAISAVALPLLALGLHPALALALAAAFVCGVGTEVFALGWNLAMQENVPDEMLSRAYSYDWLGSVVAIPIGQIAFGPLGHVFGIQHVMVVAGCVYVAVVLLTLTSRSVRDLPRAATTVPAEAC